MMQTFTVRSREREELIEITDVVREAVRACGLKEGVCVLFVQHTTAGLTINENADPDVKIDLIHALRRLIPQRGIADYTFSHAEGNSDAHLKASFCGSSVTVPFSDGELLLGRWQGIYLCEFDGGRTRRIVMTVR